MANSKNKTSKNSTTNKASNKKLEVSNTRKLPSFTSVDSTDIDNRERRDGPGGN